MRYCAIVDAYSTGRYLPDELKKYGFSCIHVQSQEEIAEHFGHSFLPESFIDNIVHKSLDQTCSYLNQYAGLEFVITGSELGVELADEISEKMGLVTNGTELSSARRNKYLMSERLRSLGIRAVKQIAAHSTEEIVVWKKEQGLDEVVVKPIASAGTDDVYFCKDASEIVAAFDNIYRKVNLVGNVNEAVLAQERLRGEQATVNAVSIDGEHYFSEFWTDKRREVESGNIAYELEELRSGEFEGRKTQEDYMKQVLDALMISHGPTHSELMLTAEGPVLIEVGARLQGGFSPETIIEGLGYNHITLTAKRYADPSGFRSFVKENNPYNVKKYICAVSLISDEEGLVEAHNEAGWNAIRSMPTFGSIVEQVDVGERLEKTVDLATIPAVFYLISKDVSLLQRDFHYLKSLPMSELYQLAS